MQEVVGSIPSGSTKFQNPRPKAGGFYLGIGLFNGGSNKWFREIIGLLWFIMRHYLWGGYGAKHPRFSSLISGGFQNIGWIFPVLASVVFDEAHAVGEGLHIVELNRHIEDGFFILCTPQGRGRDVSDFFHVRT